MEKRKIGVWGMGKVGISALDFLIRSQVPTASCNGNEPDESTKALLDTHGVTFYHQQTELEDFLQSCEYIIPSPGIDLRPYKEYQHKWLTEAYFFNKFWHKPVIAITGSLGKTSITHLLSEQLGHAGLRVATGGNIGTPMLDLLKHKSQYDIAVLELSSFQLEYTYEFAPDLAIITNLYPNHLDRHTSMQEYLQAKKNIFLNQHPHQAVLLPAELLSPKLIDPKGIKSRLFYFNPQGPEAHLNGYFFNQEQAIEKKYENEKNVVYQPDEIPPYSFAINWLIIAAALDILKLKPPLMATDSLDHRLALVGEKNGISYINDSKATVMEATLAALKTLKKKKIILILGGLSKGVNREPYFDKIPAQVKHVICFGAESIDLTSLCLKNNLSHSSSQNLELALEIAEKHAEAGDIILLSPGGSSYDLYKDYQERGNHFIDLVKKV